MKIDHFLMRFIYWKAITNSECILFDMQFIKDLTIISTEGLALVWSVERFFVKFKNDNRMNS